MMTPLVFLALSLAGGVGSGVRFVVDGAVKSALSETRFSAFPWGTFIINASGSLFLGLLTGLVISGFADSTWQTVVGTGFLGGYTTFSTASVETVNLWRTGRRTPGALNAFGVLLVTVLLAWAGLRTGMWVGGV